MQKPTEEDYRIDICEALRLNEEYNKIKDRPWYRQIKAGRNEYEIEHVDVEPPEVEKARHAAQYANYKSCEAAYRRLIELESMLDAWVSMTDWMVAAITVLRWVTGSVVGVVCGAIRAVQALRSSAVVSTSVNIWVGMGERFTG